MYLSEYCGASFKYLDELLMTNDNPLDFSQTQVIKLVKNHLLKIISNHSGQESYGKLKGHEDVHRVHFPWSVLQIEILSSATDIQLFS